MNWLMCAARSSVGAKVVMALSGVALLGFVLVHMAGNLQVFQGQEVLNNYGVVLRHFPIILWSLRFGLLVSFVLHVVSGLRLFFLNRAARPIPYTKAASVQTKISARSMVLSGLSLFAFVLYHLAHFTFGLTHPELSALRDRLGQPDIYSVVIQSFQSPLVAVPYIVAMGLLGLHLSHGASSMFQSLGINHPKYNPLIVKLGPALALLIVVGNCSMPVAALCGLIGRP